MKTGICCFLFLLGTLTASAAQKFWDGGASDSLWGSSANWSPDGVPTGSDDVILNNDLKSGSYLVSISTGVSAACRTLTVGYSGNINVITLRISSFSSVVPALTVSGNTTGGVDDIVIHAGGVLENQSSAAAASVVIDFDANTSNRARVMSGGLFRHASATSFNGSFPASGNYSIAFDSGSTMEFSGAASASAVHLSGRSFGNLIFTGAAFTVPAAAGTLTIKDDLTVKDSASADSLDLSPHTGTITFNGDLTNNGEATLIIAGPLTGPVFNGTSVINPPANAAYIKFENGFTVNATKSLNVTTDKVTIGGNKSGVVNGTLAFSASGSLANGGGGDHTVQISSGATLITARADGVEGALDAPGSFSFDAGANLTFAAAASHFAGATRQPSVVNNLTISNSGAFQTALSKNLTVNGSLVVDSGCTLAAAGRTLTLNGASSTINGQITASSGGVVTVSSGATLTLNGPTGPVINGTMNVNGNLFFAGDTPITGGAGSFALNAGGSMNIRNVLGITTSGSTGQVHTATRSFSTGASYTYDGSAAQVTGDGLPAVAANLTFNNAAGVTLTASAGTAGVLALTNGMVNTGAETLTLGSSAATPGTLSVGTGRIIGTHKRWIPTSATNTVFWLSDGVDDRIVTTEYPVNPSAGGSITASFVGSDPDGDPLDLDDDGTPLVNVANEGYWVIESGDGLAVGSANVSLSIGGFAAIGDHSTLRIVKRADSVSPWELGGTAGSNTASVIRRNNVTGFSEFGIAGTSTQVPVVMSVMSAE